MGFITEVQLHFHGPASVVCYLRRKFTPRGFQSFSPATQPTYAPQYAHLRACGVVRYTRDVAQIRASLLLRVGGVLAARIATFVYDPSGELVYEFAVWEDAAHFVCERFLQLLVGGYLQVASGWCEMRLYLRSGFITLDLSSLVKRLMGCSMCDPRVPPGYDHTWLTHPPLAINPVMESDASDWGGRSERNNVSYWLKLGRVTGQKRDSVVGTHRHEPWLNTQHLCNRGVFFDFTCEMHAAHAICEPDAFGFCVGGRGASVMLTAQHPLGLMLRGVVGRLIEPVDYETGLWRISMGPFHGIFPWAHQLCVHREHLQLGHRTPTVPGYVPLWWDIDHPANHDTWLLRLHRECNNCSSSGGTCEACALREVDEHSGDSCWSVVTDEAEEALDDDSLDSL